LSHTKATTMKKPITISQDSIEESVRNGYMIMDIPAGRFTPNTIVRIYEHYPEHICEELGFDPDNPPTNIDIQESINTLWDTYKERNIIERQRFERGCGMKIRKPRTMYQFLNFASAYIGYYGAP
jgi:hypothetical protein